MKKTRRRTKQKSASSSLYYAIHPGEMIKADWLPDYGLTPAALAQMLKIPVRQMNEIIDGHQDITKDTADRLSKYFGNSTQFWLNLQRVYERRRSEAASRIQSGRGETIYRGSFAKNAKNTPVKRPQSKRRRQKKGPMAALGYAKKLRGTPLTRTTAAWMGELRAGEKP